MLIPLQNLAEKYIQTKQRHCQHRTENLKESTFKGWRPTDGNLNRYWLIENLLNLRARNFRKAMYLYHLRGLDLLSDESKRADGIKAIQQAIKMIQEVNTNMPSSMIIQVFTDSKRKELIEVFKPTDMGTKRKAYNLLIKLDPVHASEYQKILR